jgi:glycolate oxidase subunit GlcD
MERQILKRLSSIFKNKFISGEEALSYSYDASGLFFIPDGVVLAENKEDVCKVLKLAEELGFFVIPRGRGTATTGSPLAKKGGIVLSLERMNRILEFNEEERIVVVEPGVINGELKRFLKKRGYFYPPDPASYEFSTIGGNVATGAGGPKGLKYGSTKDYVISLEVVLPGGRILKTGPPTLKQAAAYNLAPLFIGSEGTLGVITEIVLKVLPLPEKRILFVSFHQKEEEALEVISYILKSRKTPSCAEFVDKTSLKALKLCFTDKKTEILVEKDIKSLLFLEFDGNQAEVGEAVCFVENFYREKDIKFIKAEKEEEAEKLWRIRREISPALKLLGERKIADDVVVPRNYMQELLSFVRKLEKEGGIPVSCFGHAGDGNFHINLLFNEEKRKIAENLRKKILEKVISLKGTISGEHGIGYTKRSFVNLELSSFHIEVMKKLKKVFDPRGILNPLVKIPD